MKHYFCFTRIVCFSIFLLTAEIFPIIARAAGARGAAHIGVLKFLEKQHIVVDYIAGTSMGAVVGGLYASGLSPEEIEKELESIDWKDIFSDAPNRQELPFRRKKDAQKYLTGVEIGVKNGKITLPKGLIAGQKLGFLLKSLTLHTTDVDEFDRLPIPFRAIAADIETGEMVVLNRGNFAEALRASMSIPGIFSPVEIDGRLLVDGGIVRNLPVDVVRRMGADMVITVDVGMELGTYGEVRLGVEERNVGADRRVGSAVPKEDSGNQTAFVGSFAFDHLDNSNFPRYGAKFDLDYMRGMSGGELSYDKATFSMMGVASYKKHTFLA